MAKVVILMADKGHDPTGKISLVDEINEAD
mgnify:CR=1 FL=1